MKLLKVLVILFIISSLLLACDAEKQSFSIAAELKFEQEEKQENNKVLTSSTQSLNRYHSSLREFSTANLNFDANSNSINVKLEKGGKKLVLDKIDARFLLPLLPYKHDSQIDDFDKANLTLAEFARNGISLSHQKNNSKFGFFHGSDELFNDEPEYSFIGSEIGPNKNVRPKRFSIVNNCLNPGLWELSATDAVGEMFHSWFTLPYNHYFNMVKAQNNIDNPAEELKSFVESNDIFKNIPAKLDRLRNVKKEILVSKAVISQHKEIGAYSSQDSRRKVQRKFYNIQRNGAQIETKNFGDLVSGDVFSLHSFENPGVYNSKKRMDIVYNPNWEKVVFNIVEPKTSYGGKHDQYGANEYLEVELFSKDESQSIVAGNIPIQLITFAEDYRIPAFGAGVLDASENIERRFLRLEEGPYPQYAYQIEKNQKEDLLINNHLTGYEQIYFRPVLIDQDLILKMTIVSYERIVDLLEFEIPITGELKDKIMKASLAYKKPIYEVYQDSNIF